MSKLQLLATGLWSHPSSIALGPLRLPRRALVARLASGELWVHTPNALDAELRDELERLGPVRHVVAPTQMHHAHLEAWRAAYPGAKFWGAPGLAEKRADLRFDATLGTTAEAEWSDDFDQRVLRGAPRLEEVLFLHRATRTLIAADLVFHVGREASFATRLLMRLNGAYGRVAPTRVFRSMCADRDAVRRCVLELCDSWDFDAIHMSHGEPVRTGGRDLLRAGFANFR